MSKKKCDMTTEEYAIVLERMKKAREASLVSTKKKLTARQILEEKRAENAAKLSQSAVLPEPQVAEPPQPLIQAPPPTPQPPQYQAPPPPKAQPAPEIDLNAYFEAKYRAKSKYIKPKESKTQPVPIPQVAAPPPPPSMNNLMYRSATDQLRGRANEELIKMAMASVFRS